MVLGCASFLAAALSLTRRSLSLSCAGKAGGAVAKLAKAGRADSAAALWTPSEGEWMLQADAEVMAAKEGAIATTKRIHFDRAARVAELMDGPEGQSGKELCPYFKDRGGGTDIYLQIWDGAKAHDVKMTTYSKTDWVVAARRVALAERVIIQA
jgi:hypothetical protein